MTSHQLKAEMASLDIAPGELAAELQANVRTVQRWISGKQDIPANMPERLEAIRMKRQGPL